MHTTISDLVDEFAIERGYDSRHQKARLLNMAIRGLKEIHYDVSGTPTWVQLEIDNKNTASIPDGLINIIRVWVNFKGYGMCEVVETTKMTPTLITNQGAEERGDVYDSTEGVYGLDEFYNNDNPHYRLGQFTGGVYKGVGSNPFVYRRNYDTNRLEFSSNVQSPILEYLTDPLLVNGEYVVHPLIQDALLFYLHYADSRFKKYVGAGEKHFNQQKYVAAKNHARLRMSAITSGNLRAAARGSYSLSTK